MLIQRKDQFSETGAIGDAGFFSRLFVVGASGGTQSLIVELESEVEDVLDMVEYVCQPMLTHLLVGESLQRLFRRNELGRRCCQRTDPN